MSHGKEIKDSSKSSTKPLKVLVCSANLGNADPSDSFGLWIPDDGYTGKMLRNQNYPIVETEEDWERVGEDTKAADGAVDEDGEDGQSLSQARGGGYYGEQFTEMFDIIVVGLQESTWDPPSEQEASKSNINDDSTGPDADDPSSSHHSVHGAAKKAIKTVEKMTGLAEKAGKKGVSTVNTLSISRDHTKKANEIVPDGTSVLHNLLEARLPSYERILSFQRGEMRLMIYASDRHHKIKLMSVRAQNTGKAGLANKGGIVGEVQVDDTTTLAFMSCHLEAHEGVDKFSTRCSTLGTIFRGTKKYAIPAIYPDASLSSHFSFVLGDLNFRTRHNGCIKVEEQLPGVLKLIADKNWKELNKADELRMALDNQSCLCGFKTPYCNFPPTFKLERREGYFHKDQRTPSYTDRILWRTGDMLQERIKSLLYEPIDDFATSDHKPVRAAFEIRLNHPLEFRRREST